MIGDVRLQQRHARAPHSRISPLPPIRSKSLEFLVRVNHTPEQAFERRKCGLPQSSQAILESLPAVIQPSLPEIEAGEHPFDDMISQQLRFRMSTAELTSQQCIGVSEMEIKGRSPEVLGVNDVKPRTIRDLFDHTPNVQSASRLLGKPPLVESPILIGQGINEMELVGDVDHCLRVCDERIGNGVDGGS